MSLQFNARQKSLMETLATRLIKMSRGRQLSNSLHLSLVIHSPACLHPLSLSLSPLSLSLLSVHPTDRLVEGKVEQPCKHTHKLPPPPLLPLCMYCTVLVGFFLSFLHWFLPCNLLLLTFSLLPSLSTVLSHSLFIHFSFLSYILSCVFMDILPSFSSFPFLCFPLSPYTHSLFFLRKGGKG